MCISDGLNTTQLAIGIGQEAKDSTIQLTQMVCGSYCDFSFPLLATILPPLCLI